MSDNLVIESPDFDAIEKKAGYATRNAVTLLWEVLNQEIKLRRQTVRDAKQTFETKITSAAPTVQQDNFDTDRSTIYYFTGAGAWTLTGLRNGVEGAMKFLHNTGAGTVTIANNSASSDLSNRLLTSTGANKSLTTDLSILFLYINSRWREFKIL